MMHIEFFISGPINTNAYLLACLETKCAIFVDPSPSSADLLLAAAKNRDLNVEAIFLTHSHWDHMADAPTLKKNLKIPIYVHPLDRENLRKPGSDGIALSFPGFSFEGIEPDFELCDGSNYNIGTHQFQVIHTPGHSPGSVCFYFPKESILISGDTLFNGSIGNLSLPTAEPEKMWKSLKRLDKLPEETVVYPGHGEKTTIGGENWLSRAENLFLLS